MIETNECVKCENNKECKQTNDMKLVCMPMKEQIKYFKTKHPLGCSMDCEIKSVCSRVDDLIQECWLSI